MTEQREPVDEPVTDPGQGGGSRWAPVEPGPAFVPQGDEPAGQAEDATSAPAQAVAVPEAEAATEPVAAEAGPEPTTMIEPE
ncbi:MAG: hypothetical protein AAGC63_12920, partial [Propionicimonas sp.]